MACMQRVRTLRRPFSEKLWKMSNSSWRCSTLRSSSAGTAPCRVCCFRVPTNLRKIYSGCECYMMNLMLTHWWESCEESKVTFEKKKKKGDWVMSYLSQTFMHSGTSGSPCWLALCCQISSNLESTERDWGWMYMGQGPSENGATPNCCRRVFWRKVRGNKVSDTRCVTNFLN